MESLAEATPEAPVAAAAAEVPPTEDKAAAAVQKKEAGNQAFAAKDLDGAIHLYSEAIALDPDSHVYYSNRAAVYQAKGDFAKAEEDARECLRRKPDFVKGYFRLALAQTELGNLEDAEKSLKAGLQTDAGNPDLSRQLRLVRAKKASQNRRAKASAGGGAGRAGAPRMDEAAAKELSELGDQYQETQRELGAVQQKQRFCTIDLKKVDITRQQVATLDENVNIMRGIGKMFLQASKTEILQSLGEGKEKGEKLVAELATKQKYLQRRLESQERNLKEIMANAQAGGDA